MKAAFTLVKIHLCFSLCKAGIFQSQSVQGRNVALNTLAVRALCNVMFLGSETREISDYFLT